MAEKEIVNKGLNITPLTERYLKNKYQYKSSININKYISNLSSKNHKIIISTESLPKLDSNRTEETILPNPWTNDDPKEIRRFLDGFTPKSKKDNGMIEVKSSLDVPK